MADEHNNTESETEIGDDEYMELIVKLDEENEKIRREKIEGDIQKKHMSGYIKKLQDENIEYYNKLKLYQKTEGTRRSKLSNLLSSIGKSVPREFYEESEERYRKYIEEMERDHQRRKQ